MENLKKDFKKIVDLIFNLELKTWFYTFEKQAKNQIWEIYINDDKDFNSFKIIFKNFWFYDKIFKISGGIPTRESNFKKECGRVNFELKNLLLDKRQIKEYNKKIILFLEKKIEEQEKNRKNIIKEQIKDYREKIKELKKELVNN